MIGAHHSALQAQYYILTLQRMFKSTSSSYQVDKLGEYPLEKIYLANFYDLSKSEPNRLGKSKEIRKKAKLMNCTYWLPLYLLQISVLALQKGDYGPVDCTGAK